MDAETFQELGFHVERALLGADEVVQIRDEYERTMCAAHGLTHRDAAQDQMVPCLDPRTPLLASLLERSSLVDAVRGVLGADVLAAFSSVNRFVGDTHWHTETHEPGIDGIKVAFYLEPVSASSGALRVIPGSHRTPMTPHEKEALRQAADSVTAHVCETVPGDAILFDTRLWHASYGGDRFRSSVQVRYFRNPTTPAQERDAVAMGWAAPAMLERYGVPNVPMWHPDWLGDPAQSPLRRRWIARMRELQWVPPQL